MRTDLKEDNIANNGQLQIQDKMCIIFLWVK